MNPLPVAWPPPGRYLLAISGGADSMALLHLMMTAALSRGYQLVVGHVDHGLRPDSAADRQLVVATARRYGLLAVWHQAHLPATASEAVARAARHGWLEAERRRQRAVAVITAHHQDDLIETSLLNLARGTGRQGLAPMQAGLICRPLLGISRAQLREYARHQHLAWHEDSTNANLTNPRNLLRQRLLPAASNSWRTQYLAAISELAELNQAIQVELEGWLAAGAGATVNLGSTGVTSADATLAGPGYNWPVPLIRQLSLAETAELLKAAAQRLRPNHELNHRLLEELALFAQTAQAGRRRPVTSTLWLERRRQTLTLCDFGLPQI